MNIQESDVMNSLIQERYINQRILSEQCGHSLGVVNRSVRELIRQGFLEESLNLTEKARRMVDDRSPRSAIILAAGFGMRMVPINLESPKAMLEVDGEKLIERQIRQLHEVGVYRIYVVVGFMKEQFEYLIDEFNVELIINPMYAGRNNLHSLKVALDYIVRRDELTNTYIVPSDIWGKHNPFRKNELYSWYMVSDQTDEDSNVRVNRKMELVRVRNGEGNKMLGISYLLKEDLVDIRGQIDAMDGSRQHDGDFWETALYSGEKMILPARVVHASYFVEINTYEALRELDSNSQHLKTEAITVIARELKADKHDIVDINVLKKGMTNRSFSFSCRGKRYIMRIPGEGTNQLIDRNQEAEVYRAISGKGLCDDPIYIDSSTGFKITEYLEGVQSCDPYDVSELKKCMTCLKKFHDMELKVKHEFDLFDRIEFYESLWNGHPSMYRDYVATKKNVLALKSYIDAHTEKKVLSHIDAVPDNFLFYDRGFGEELQLTDWEYAGMQDPHVDIAMFCVYALYDKQQVDRLISLYFDGNCPDETRIKIYCYIAVCGLLWSNWCEYKSVLGVEFGEYSLRQYRYAKEYSRLVRNELENRVREE